MNEEADGTCRLRCRSDFCFAAAGGGCGDVERSLPVGATVADLVQALAVEYPRLPTASRPIYAAVNRAYAGEDTVLQRWRRGGVFSAGQRRPGWAAAVRDHRRRRCRWTTWPAGWRRPAVARSPSSPAWCAARPTWPTPTRPRRPTVSGDEQGRLAPTTWSTRPTPRWPKPMLAAARRGGPGALAADRGRQHRPSHRPHRGGRAQRGHRRGRGASQGRLRRVQLRHRAAEGGRADLEKRGRQRRPVVGRRAARGQSTQLVLSVRLF